MNLERVWREAVVQCLMELSWHSPERTDKTSARIQASESRFEIGNC
jgi:hypothetical protein